MLCSDLKCWCCNGIHSFFALKLKWFHSGARVCLKSDQNLSLWFLKNDIYLKLSIFENSSIRFQKIAWILYHHLQWKFKLLTGKFTWGNKAKHCCKRWKGHTSFQLAHKNNVLPLHLKQTFPPIFEFLLKVKVMGSNPGYHLKSFLL